LGGSSRIRRKKLKALTRNNVLDNVTLFRLTNAVVSEGETLAGLVRTAEVVEPKA
jgi:hypothetical protein